MSFIEWLTREDKQWFLWIQAHLTGSVIDPVMVLARNPLTWIPLYAFILYWIFRTDKKLAFRFILLSLVVFGLGDYSAANWIKPAVGRVRPCYDPDVMGVLRGLIDCGGRYSFPSNHACNHFSLATFWFLSIRLISGRRWYWLWAWAVLVCFAQVYVGKHFPLDVIGGAIYGTCLGLAGYWAFRKWTAKAPSSGYKQA